MATIKEIAELAGVSRGTVDRVLNNRGSVNRETAEKIRAIIKQLGYKPNPEKEISDRRHSVQQKKPVF